MNITTNNNYNYAFKSYKTNFVKNTFLSEKALGTYQNEIKDRQIGAFLTESLSAAGGLCMLSITALSSITLIKGLIETLPLNIIAGATITSFGTFLSKFFYKLYKSEKQENFKALSKIAEEHYPEIESPEYIINQNNQFYNNYKGDSIINYISDSKCTPKELYAFLCKISSDTNTAKILAKEFSANPRGAGNLKNMLINKLGNNSKAEIYFNTWFYDEKYGYRKVYANYYKHDLFENAKDLLTIVKQSPNIGTWAFKQKAASLGVEPTLGNIPKKFGTKEDFDKILSELTKIEKSSNSSLKERTELIINDKKYFVSKIDAGHSAKAKYIIETNNDEKYVLKFSPYNLSGNTDRSKKFNDSFMLRGDSPYMDALVDFYLKENNCPNAPDIEYFDYNKKAILYKMTIGKVIDIKDLDFYNAYLLNNSDRLKDVKDLGVLINDINYKNILETPEGRLVIVDTGHSAYSSPFRPMVPGINIALSNTCGREMV